MTPQMEFFIFLIEQYAAYKKRSADEVLSEWDSLGISDHIFEMYEMYHTERIENAYEDIDRIILERKSSLS